MIDIRAFSTNKRSPKRLALSCKYCGAATHEGKDECGKHLGKRPYVAELLKTLEQIEKEETQILKRGVAVVKLDGFHVKEILNELEVRGARTPGGLARAIRIPHGVVKVCLKKMLRANLIRMLEGEVRLV